jgi:Heavy metal associated domain 2
MFSKKLSESDQNTTQTNSTNNEFYRIAHAIPGRIRFYIPQIAKDSEYRNKLKEEIEESNFKITEVRINKGAASVAINYQSTKISDEEMRSHLINLIQSVSKQVEEQNFQNSDAIDVSAQAVVETTCNAAIELIDSTRNINQVRNAMTRGRFKTDFWERLLNGAKAIIRKIRAGIIFILNKKAQLISE